MGCLTIYTDASWSATSKVAGYGFWARDKHFIMAGQGGELDIRCNNAAEIRAIAYALFRLEKEKLAHVKDKPYCTVVTDSKVAMEYYLDAKYHERFGTTPYEFVMGLMKKYNIKFNVRWVKGHSNHDGARSWVNSKVDKRANDARLSKESLNGY